MAAKKGRRVEEPESVSKPVEMTSDEENKLDPQEEKMLDWILKAIVIFVLGWLGLSVLMVIGGLFGLWK